MIPRDYLKECKNLVMESFPKADISEGKDGNFQVYLESHLSIIVWDEGTPYSEIHQKSRGYEVLKKPGLSKIIKFKGLCKKLKALAA